MSQTAEVIDDILIVITIKSAECDEEERKKREGNVLGLIRRPWGS